MRVLRRTVSCARPRARARGVPEKRGGQAAEAISYGKKKRRRRNRDHLDLMSYPARAWIAFKHTNSITVHESYVDDVIANDQISRTLARQDAS